MTVNNETDLHNAKQGAEKAARVVEGGMAKVDAVIKRLAPLNNATLHQFAAYAPEPKITTPEKPRQHQQQQSQNNLDGPSESKGPSTSPRP